ncbi:MAG: aminotransferase class I/II-fold pyridoxal phosphate-dependent enzyme [Bacteroidota bacterium]
MSIIDQAYDSKVFRKTGHQLVDQIADHLERTISRGKEKVYPHYDPEMLFKSWNNGDLLSQDAPVADFFQLVMDMSVDHHHFADMGHQVTPTAMVSVLSEMVSAYTNCGMGVYEVGPLPVVLEKWTINFMGSTFGLPETEGVLTSGGTLGNLTALLAARQAMIAEDVWNEGLGEKRYGFMISEEAHYSVERAVKIMGLGEAGLIKVPVNDQFQMDTSHLLECYNEAIDAGIQVLGVIGSSCSTATGSFDDLDAIASFCAEHKLWFHVDAAHGGAAIFSDQYKHLVKGIERADSIIIDFHKMLLTPSLATAVLFKQAASSYNTFNPKAQYLWSDDQQREWYNLANRTFECTKPMLSVRIYSLLHAHGPDLWAEYVERQFDLGRTFGEILDAEPDFDLPHQPECNLVCFRYRPNHLSESELDRLNVIIRKEILKEGRFYIVQTTLQNQTYLRVSLMNPFTTAEDLEGLLTAVRGAGSKALVTVTN